MKQSVAELVVLYFVDRLGEVTKTKLAKMLFIADRRYFERTNQTITGFVYRRSFFGPYPAELEDVVGSLIVKRLLRQYELVTITPECETVVRYPLVRTERLVMYDDLDDEQRQIIDEVVDEFGEMSLDELVEMMCEFEEVKSAEFGEEIIFTKEEWHEPNDTTVQ